MEEGIQCQVVVAIPMYQNTEKSQVVPLWHLKMKKRKQYAGDSWEKIVRFQQFRN